MFSSDSDQFGSDLRCFKYSVSLTVKAQNAYRKVNSHLFAAFFLNHSTAVSAYKDAINIDHLLVTFKATAPPTHMHQYTLSGQFFTELVLENEYPIIYVICIDICYVLCKARQPFIEI